METEVAAIGVAGIVIVMALQFGVEWLAQQICEPLASGCALEDILSSECWTARLAKIIVDILPETAFAFCFLFYGNYKAALAWEGRSDWKKISLSVTIIEPKPQASGQRTKFSMLIRGINETTIDSVMTNPMAQNAVEAACRETTQGMPFLLLEGHESLNVDLVNAFLNWISSQSGNNYLRMASGLRMVEHSYVFALTFEQNWRGSPNHSAKLRVLLVRELQLDQIERGEIQPDDMVYSSGSSYHRDRFNDLCRMARENKRNGRNSAWLGRLRICMPVPGENGTSSQSDHLEEGEDLGPSGSSGQVSLTTTACRRTATTDVQLAVGVAAVEQWWWWRRWSVIPRFCIDGDDGDDGVFWLQAGTVHWAIGRHHSAGPPNSRLLHAPPRSSFDPNPPCNESPLPALLALAAEPNSLFFPHTSAIILLNLLRQVQSAVTRTQWSAPLARREALVRVSRPGWCTCLRGRSNRHRAC